MVSRAKPHSFQLVLLATLLAHGGLLLLKRAELIFPEQEALAPIQLTMFGSDSPFVPGTPSATPAKAKPVVAKSTIAPKAAATSKQDSVSVQEAALNSTQATGSGGVASSFNAAGSMAAGDLRAIYLSELRAKLEEVKNYPLQARRLGQTGSVEVSFKVRADGLIADARIVRPSPFKRLNDSALATVEGLGKFRPLPEGLGSGDSLLVTLPIRYSIQN